MSYFNERLLKMNLNSTLQEFSAVIEPFPSNIKEMLIKGKMKNDALVHELKVIEAKIAKAKAERKQLEESLAKAKEEQKEPSAAFNGVMAILKAKYSK